MALGVLSSHRQTIHSGGVAPGTVLFANCSHVPGVCRAMMISKENKTSKDRGGGGSALHLRTSIHKKM